ncbi:MAG TPA: CoA-binding protein, partial [Acidobacteriota bacterium]|nr:CoA-binding protein [Acidobacteriota bacterium]
SEDSRKYGHIILNDLRRAGYQVYPVNKKGGEMDGMKVFESVSELPKEVEVIDFVIPASQGKKVARQCAEAGFKNVWLQPGAESDELVELCWELGLRVVHNHCAMVEKSRRSKSVS